MPAWVGSMLETSIGTASNLAFATLPGVTLACDAFPGRRFYAEEITDQVLELSGPGVMRPLDAPASALQPLAPRLEKRVVSHASLKL